MNTSQKLKTKDFKLSLKKEFEIAYGHPLGYLFTFLLFALITIIFIL